jgi:AraC-like DNA-binding protein
VPLAQLDNPDASFPLAALVRVFVLAAERWEMPDLGLRLAAFQDMTVLGNIALIALHSDTVEAAILGISRNMPYHSPALHSELLREGTLACVRITHDLSMASDEKRHLAELTLRNAVAMMRTIAQVPGDDWAVHFDHEPVLPQSTYREAFGCAVRFGEACDALCFPVEILDRACRTANPVLRDAAERYVRTVIRRYPIDLRRQIEELLGRQLGSGGYTLPVVARQLCLSGRSLQRQLEAQGLNFEDIVDDLRRQRATELLPIIGMPMMRVAECLGYSGQASFTRSCRRWFGKTPKALRAAALGRV